MSKLVKPNISTPLFEWLKYHFVEKKFITAFRLVLMIVWGFAIVYITNDINFTFLVVIASVAIGILILLVCLRYPLFGLYFTLVFSSLFALPGRFYNIQSPIGILVEVFTYVLWISVLANSKFHTEDTAAFRKHPITVVLIIIMMYYILELANPFMTSKVGWLFFFRKQISFLLLFFIAYIVLNSYEKIKFFLKFWIMLAVVIAVYGIKQQWLGLASFEKLWIGSDPLLMKLYVQGGFLRKFSFLTDPATFGIICAAFGMLTLVLAIRLRRALQKSCLYLASIILLLASSYSGTRTCNVMIMAGLTGYGIFTINEKKTFLIAASSLFLLAFLFTGPFQNNPVIHRIKTTFQGSKDASASVRDINRHSIQPYIHSHPIGGGLNTSSSEGALYNPKHTLAGFPPDSGYMKILLEQGWIGFAIHLFLYFVILKRGIDGFVTAHNHSIKTIYLALTVCLFSMIVGQYSQIAIGQYPLILFYYSSLAVLIKLINYDKPLTAD